MVRDLRGADLRGADLVGADLRDTDLRGADLAGADLSGALLHGADLRQTRFGKSALGHRGGDPELTSIYDPEIFGARADDRTRWPEGFDTSGHGVIYDGPHVLTIEGDVAVPPKHRRDPDDGHGRFWKAQGWLALIDTDGGPTSAPGTLLLAFNLHLIVGQPALHPASADGGNDDTTWRVVAHDDNKKRLSLQRHGETVVVSTKKVLKSNVSRWWWHVPGSEWVAQS